VGNHVPLGGWVEFVLHEVHHPQLVPSGWLKGRVSVLVDVRLLMEAAAGLATFGNATDGKIVAEAMFDERIGVGGRRSRWSLDA
jgi:hypothetical protein